MVEIFHWLGRQFSNLFDPGTALGAFLISCLASCTCSFIGGVKWKEHTVKKNKITSDEIKGSIHQDIHIQTQGDSSAVRKISKKMRLMLKRLMEMFGRTPKNKKQNNISADVVNGDIIQDASVENNYIMLNDPAIVIRNIGKNPEELEECFET